MAKRTHNVEGVINCGQLQSFIKRIENVHEQKASLSDDEKAIYAEAKCNGFEPKIIRAVVSRRKKDPEKLRLFEEELALYLTAIGDLANTPLGAAGQPKNSN